MTRLLSCAAVAVALCSGSLARDLPAPEPTKLDVEATLSALDSNGDGTVSRNEAARMPVFRDGFRRLDKNRDGRLDVRELGQASIVPEPDTGKE